jgi:membrane-associated phospholipid phosphatase
MKALIAFLNPIKIYVYAYALLLIAALIPQLLYSQETIFLAINGYHNGFLDLFFSIITYYGDGLAFVVVILALAFFSFSRMFMGLVVFLATSFTAQFLKRVFFNNRFRPYKVLGGDHNLYIPDGVSPITMNSFPSGHTVTAFALSTFLLLILPRKSYLSGALLIMAGLTAYSRVYLTHHFAIDVWSGSIIGVVVSILTYWWLENYFDRKFGQKSLLKR